MPTPSFRKLKSFFETSPAAREATKPLAKAAEVAVLFESGHAARFWVDEGTPRLVAEQATDPDFTLVIPDRAVDEVTGLKDAGVGEYGVAFFSLALSKDPATKIRVRINAPTTRLLTRGYLGTLAIGGAKVSWWLLKNGVKNPKAAIDKLRNTGA
jgi:hypothetical protein